MGVAMLKLEAHKELGKVQSVALAWDIGIGIIALRGYR